MAAIAQSRNLFSPGCCSSSNGSRKKLNDLKNLSSWSFVRATTKRGGAEREVWRSTGLVCRAEGNGDGRKKDNKNENEMENPFDLEKEMEKVLESEESKVFKQCWISLSVGYGGSSMLRKMISLLQLA